MSPDCSVGALSGQISFLADFIKGKNATRPGPIYEKQLSCESIVKELWPTLI